MSPRIIIAAGLLALAGCASPTEQVEQRYQANQRRVAILREQQMASEQRRLEEPCRRDGCSAIEWRRVQRVVECLNDPAHVRYECQTQEERAAALYELERPTRERRINAELDREIAQEDQRSANVRNARKPSSGR